jgi:hypothetical protein
MKSCGRQAERAVTKNGTNQLGESSGNLVGWLAGGVYALFWGGYYLPRKATLAAAGVGSFEKIVLKA